MAPEVSVAEREPTTKDSATECDGSPPRECWHPEHFDREPTAYSKSRCLCYDCLLRRDNVIGNAVTRMVDVVERGTLAQIQAQAGNLDAALWDTGLYIRSGAAAIIEQANAVQPTPTARADE